MPIFTLSTNLVASKVPANFKFGLLDLVAKLLNKPKMYVAVHIRADQDLTFGGSTEPAALCELLSIGGIGREVNKATSRQIMEFIEKELNISPERNYIIFKDDQKVNVGYNKTTFDDII